jgi:hypothetical protein
MFVAIVLISVILEISMHRLDHAMEDQPHYKEMVKKVYAVCPLCQHTNATWKAAVHILIFMCCYGGQELTILGFLSFGLTIVREVAREEDGGETIESYTLVNPPFVNLASVFLCAARRQAVPRSSRTLSSI